ncbi:DNA kinase/phosphatase Pnk1 [Blastocladiella emersonii ATCC 22665]|nr:DNA kinase/phosphatase Pnk1 [Blastocladiella emersonii ATCC 22665]
MKLKTTSSTCGNEQHAKSNSTADGEKPRIHPFFTNMGRHRQTSAATAVAAGEVTIHEEDTLCIVEYMSPAPSSTIASFDLDKTLIATKSGAKWPKNDDDWVLLYPTRVPERLKELHENGAKIVVFTNQAGIGSNRSKLVGFQGKVINIARAIGVPMQIFIATHKDIYRKPRPGMWDHLVAHCNQAKDAPEPVAIDVNASFFVGDAAGRPDGWKASTKKDFADTDRKFAVNVGIEFHTPEEFFLGEPAAPFHFGGQFDPTAMRKLAERHEHEELDLVELIRPVGPGEREILVFSGSPASGKSRVAQWLADAHGYQVINQDSLKTFAKCVKACRAMVKEGGPVVIDNTNAAVDTRAEYIRIAQEEGIPIRSAHFLTPIDLALHLNHLRALTSEREAVPYVAFNTFKSRFVVPTVDEGFAEVIKVPFVPRFEDPAHLRLASMWLH